MNIFSWSVPFVAEKTVEIFGVLLGGKTKVTKTDKAQFQKEIKKENKDISRKDVIKNKIKFVGKMNSMFKTVREEQETILELKGLCPGHKIPPGLLSGGKMALHDAVDKFKNCKQLDSENEGMPDETKIETESRSKPKRSSTNKKKSRYED